MNTSGQHRFTLQPYKGIKSRHTCPACHKKREFARYVDIESGNYLADHVGRCNRESSCGYHYKPADYFRDNPQKAIRNDFIPKQPIPAKPSEPQTISEIPYQYFEGSLKAYHQNNFVQYLESVFPSEMVQTAVRKYRIGTSKHWPGSTVFWQIATDGTIRAGKVMKYDPTTTLCKRIKHPFNHITWVHAILKLQNYHLEQCFFGEHLVSGNDKPIQIVESEKTAVVGSMMMPEFIWIATGGKNGCKWTDERVFQSLAGRTVVLWPDLNAYDDWNTKAEKLRSMADIQVSDLLERKSNETDRQNGLDVADFLLMQAINQKTTYLMNSDQESQSFNQSIPETQSFIEPETDFDYSIFPSDPCPF